MLHLTLSLIQGKNWNLLNDILNFSISQLVNTKLKIFLGHILVLIEPIWLPLFIYIYFWAQLVPKIALCKKNLPKNHFSRHMYQRYLLLILTNYWSKFSVVYMKFLPYSKINVMLLFEYCNNSFESHLLKSAHFEKMVTLEIRFSNTQSLESAIPKKHANVSKLSLV